MTEIKPDNEEEKDLLDEEVTSDADKNENSDEPIDFDSDEEEVSLEQLSAAYAQVLKKRPPDEEPSYQGASHQVFAETSHADVESESDETTDPKVDDNAACPISPSSILEAILFVGGPKEVKLTSRKIAAVMRDVSPKEITALAKSLNKTYEQEKRAYRIVTEKGAIRMELHPDMLPVQNHILGRDRATKLSQQAINVLAIVAYNQPVTREQVDKIRTISSGNILNQMLKRDLLQLEVTESTPKQKFYRTSDRFLDLFGLDAIEDLPQSHDVSDIEELAD